MIDRVELHTIVGADEVEAIIEQNHLEYCTKGKKTYWESGEYGKFDGLYVKIDEHGRVEIACSLHKIWRKHAEDGKLDNSRMFCITDALACIELLQDITGIGLRTSVVHYFEVGLSLQMSSEAINYIVEVDCVEAGKETKRLFVDANYEEDRQKTSTKTKDMRKVMKIYDKTFEAEERGREGVDPHVLRIETIYKRQKVTMAEFGTRDFLEKYARRFRADWLALHFRPVMRAKAGTKVSEIAKATDIIKEGVDAYLARNRKDYKEGRLTAKQWRTIREFAEDWTNKSKDFCLVEGKEQKEYKVAINQAFKTAIL